MVKDVIGFGALNLDMIYRMPKEELLSLLGRFGATYGTQAVLPSHALNAALDYFDGRAIWEDIAGGGSAANTVFALDKIGFRTGYVGKVGQDPAGAFILDSFGKVDVSRVQRGGRSGVCIVLVDETGERTVLVFPRCNDEIRFEDIDLNDARQTEFLHITSFAGDAAFGAQIKVIERLGHGVKISFDPGELYAARGLGAIMPILSRSYIVFANEYEIELLTGKAWCDGARELLSCGPAIVVCKQGVVGSTIFARDYDCKLQVLASKVGVVDTVGAGDVYAAGFLAGLLCDLPVSSAALMASSAATQSVTGRGRDAYPDKRLLRQFGR